MDKIDLNLYRNFYFVGIGGIGMSALARYFHSTGNKVLGYDKTSTQLTSDLIDEGIQISFEDKIDESVSSLSAEDTLVIYTPAIKQLSILEDFEKRGFTILKRAQVLGLITKKTECFAVAGTHGKTTTSSLLAHLCKEVNLPFSCFLGGISENLQSNFFHNGNEIAVVEADEFDRSFLNLSPDWAIITSTDADHLDIYGDAHSIVEGFNAFANLVPSDKQILVRKGTEIHRKAYTYAVNEQADFYSDNIRLVGDLFYFDFHTKEETIKDFSWSIPGIHNIENATAAIALLHLKGIGFDELKKAISKFKGIKRRYTKHIFNNGKIYIDDYAHHPTELNAVIGSIKKFYPEKKLLILFQPHLFSRTKDFADEFAKSLSVADELLLLEIYPARELQKDYEGITSDWLLNKVEILDKEVVTLGETLEKAKTKKFDIILTVGAGNIDTLYKPIVNWLSGE